MATYRVRINPAAFNSGQPFFGIATPVAKIVIGNGNGEPIIPAINANHPFRGGSSLVVSTDGFYMSDNTWKVLPTNMLAQLADYVTRNIVIVDLDGVARTAAQILPP